MDRQNWDSTFRFRFERHEQELHALFLSLYPGDGQAYEPFVEMLRRCYEARPDTMRSLDQQRLASPGWYRGHELVGMLMYVNAFAGTLKGVRDKLDYVQACGVNYLHLMPLLESPEGRSDGGYAVADFRKVQPALGTMEDLARLADDCHERGIAVCLDFVMNHTSEDHAWARRARAGEKEYQERYFFYDSWDIPREFERTVPQVFPTTAPGNFSWCSEAGKVVMTTFYPYQWDLNYANPEVFRDMTENMLFLCNRGVDIIRLDAVPYIWKQLGTNCRNLPQVHTLVRIMRMVCEIVCPGTLLLGEVVMEPSKVVPYFGTQDKPECDMLYNVTTMATIWHTLATRDVRLLRHQLGQIADLPANCIFQNYLRCHDDIGWGLDYDYLGWFGVKEAEHKKYLNDWFTGRWGISPSRGELYNDSEKFRDARLCGTTASLCGVESALYEGNEAALDLAVAADVMLHACMLTLRGIPVLYSGDEVGMLNDYTYHDDPGRWSDSRNIHRGKFDWEQAEDRHDLSTPAGRIFHAIRHLVMIRKNNDIFHSDAKLYPVNTGDDRVLGMVREYNGKRMLGLFNFSEHYCRTEIETRDRIDMAVPEREYIPGEGRMSEYWLEPYGFRWFLEK